MAWEVEYTDQFGDWDRELGDKEAEAIDAAVALLQRSGPAFGQPLVDTIRGSCHANMKELRPLAGHIRILFAFDPRRTAILLIGGDKTNVWNRWYRHMIPVTDALNDEHLATRWNEERAP